MRQAVWMGDYLVGLIEGTKLYYVQPDHLGTPRAVVDPVRNTTVWRLRPTDDPFGTSSPDEDPDSDGTRFVLDLRFPGQRYDAATGLHYNYYRDYDPATGRYVQVDPIGLAGGLNPYLYANGSPLRYTDPSGNIPLPVITAAIGAAGGAVGDALIQVVGMYRSDWCKSFNWRQLGVSALLGATGGVALPATRGLVGVSAVGGLAGYGGHLANGGGVTDIEGLWAISAGVAAGAVGGTVTHITKHGMGGTAASAGLVKRSNEAAAMRANAGTVNVLRGAAGGTVASAPGLSGPCGCNE